MRKLAVMLVLWGGSCAAEQFDEVVVYDGNEMHDWCSDDSDAEILLCRGFVAAAASYATDIQNLPRACIPAGVTVNQLVDVYAKYLEENPSERHRPAIILARIAFQKAFSCF